MRLKQIILAVTAAFLFTMCGTANTSKTTAVKKTKPEIQYKDDFRAAGNEEKTALLKELSASGTNYSVLILTKNYKGEKITVTNTKKSLYNAYPISDLKTGIADKARIDNTLDTRIYDNRSKQEAIIPASEAKKYKFIYIMKNLEADNPFVITYSNTLRPLD